MHPTKPFPWNQLANGHLCAIMSHWLGYNYLAINCLDDVIFCDYMLSPVPVPPPLWRAPHTYNTHISPPPEPAVVNCTVVLRGKKFRATHRSRAIGSLTRRLVCEKAEPCIVEWKPYMDLEGVKMGC